MWIWLLACGPGTAPGPNPFDRDGDGAFGLVDCDDNNAGIYPGAPDPPYDGVDGDCRGDDDYDADGDGERWVGQGGTDCNDNDPAVNTKAVEVPYDGRDNDCDPTTSDDDQDGDGSRWPTDCDDDDPERYPGAPERLGDRIDQDCGNDGDGTTLRAFPEAFTAPAGTRLTDFEGAPALAVHADFTLLDPPPEPDPKVYTTPTTEPPPDPEVGLAILWADAAGPAPERVVWHGAGQFEPLQADVPRSIDIQGTPDTLWLALGVNPWLSGRDRATLLPYVRFGANLVRQNAPFRDLDTALLDTVDVHVDDLGTAWLAVASPDQLTWVSGALNTSGTSGTAPVDASGGAAMAGPLPELWSCTAGGLCDLWELPTDGPPLLDGPLDGVVSILREHDGLHIVRAGPTGVRLIGPDLNLSLFPGEVVVDADAVVVDGPSGPRVAAVGVLSSDGIDELWLSFGEVDLGAYSIVSLKLPPDLNPHDAAVWADGERVFVAATGWDRLGIDLLDRVVVAELPWTD